MRRPFRRFLAALSLGACAQFGGCFYEVALRNQPFIQVPVTRLSPPASTEGMTRGLSAITLQQDSITIANPLRVEFGLRGGGR
ncbi:MAG: hypothetical protein LC135_13740 [Phycisphaerae bacterium]|jgi:hypothetical protein|nr:hypothetical protein [Phycisphaerae bacterium]MCZ2400912.1 hypothetical protein [Phycisphaerae bacterium]NUQ48913.1 hypothetical protein [Phycisphaerae bacterium]